LFDVRIFLLEFICQTETDDRKARGIALWIIVFEVFVNVRERFVNRRETSIV
jgi:hypothetical protein